ncbi:tetratricopeptide repeat protein [Uliginosibacterium paludis]|uniref:Tetratricopeptide repeat protein n=1 Tax=Uliginosibacterium paludis TaxID=1615952 RepID=A0ABV2CPI0_9RHOO
MSPDCRTRLLMAREMQRAGQPAVAEGLYRSVLQEQARLPEVWRELGVLCLLQGRAAEAADCFERLLALQPDDAGACNNLGLARERCGQPAAARAAYEQGLLRAPDHADTLNNLGNLLRALGEHERALAMFDRLVQIEPQAADAHNNRGRVLHELARCAEAGLAYRQALALAPDYAEAHWNAALNLLLEGDYPAGWKAYEWRWKKPSFTSRRRSFRQPQWLGQTSLQGRSLLIHAEQGLGDTLQFLRYLPRLRAAGAEVILEVQPGLKRLCEHAFAGIRVLAQGETLPQTDFHSPLLSLPLAFGDTLASIPCERAYLKPDPAALAAWQQRLASLPGPRIGLVWSGSAAHQDDANRSLPLASLQPLQALDAGFVSLQKALRPLDRPAFEAWPGLLDASSGLEDFADTAALVAALDLVIAVDTSVAHLAGALGVPVCILLSPTPEWRWLLERTDSPWYPSARLFRRTRGEGVEPMIAALVAELRETVLRR